MGTPGAAGTPGAPGAPGTDGLHCWDLDASGQCDGAEDVNADMVCDALDCQGPQGPQGPPGSGGGTLSCTMSVGPTVLIGPGQTLPLVSVAHCPSGYVVTGGGWLNHTGSPADDITVFDNFPQNDTAWRVSMTNNSSVTSFAFSSRGRCCRL